MFTTVGMAEECTKLSIDPEQGPALEGMQGAVCRVSPRAWCCSTSTRENTCKVVSAIDTIFSRFGKHLRVETLCPSILLQLRYQPSSLPCSCTNMHAVQSGTALLLRDFVTSCSRCVSLVASTHLLSALGPPGKSPVRLWRRYVFDGLLTGWLILRPDWSCCKTWFSFGNDHGAQRDSASAESEQGG